MIRLKHFASATNDKSKRVSPREYFAYHLNMRNLEADFLFRCGRLFQEYICLACAIIESQKLKFHKNNQKALRADTYKNVQEIVEERVPLGDQISRDDHNLKIGKRIILSNVLLGAQDGIIVSFKTAWQSVANITNLTFS